MLKKSTNWHEVLILTYKILAQFKKTRKVDAMTSILRNNSYGY